MLNVKENCIPRFDLRPHRITENLEDVHLLISTFDCIKNSVRVRVSTNFCVIHSVLIADIHP